MDSGSMLISVQEEVRTCLLDNAEQTFQSWPKSKLLEESLKTLRSPLMFPSEMEPRDGDFNHITHNVLLQIARARYCSQLIELLKSDKEQFVKDMETIVGKKISLIFTRNSLKPKNKGNDDMFKKMDALKKSIRVEIEAPFIQAAELFDSCYQHELTFFGISVGDSADHESKTMINTINSLESKFDAIAALIAVEVLCESPKISGTRDGQVEKLSRKIVKKAADWFDGFVHEFQTVIQNTVVNKSDSASWKEDGLEDGIRVFQSVLKHLTEFEPERMNEVW
eukprot:CAMPEP_0115022886 /NCGR_PEP_ID=MMETSP0216-20121206/31912_1 /TAXON_ID=223996 /ORGANISM="Protocruzia adherens, Strain Boccale" /LENGTH=280 /DNA_ID=CAMNT_0002395845 /DNA_START=58 /DNA_END=897 /DNA_ORIENTATION=-